MKISIADLELYQRCPRAYKLHVMDEVLPQHKSLSLCKAKVAKEVIASLHGSKSLAEITAPEIEKLCEQLWQEEIADPQVDQAELSAIVIQAKPATKSKEATLAVTKAQKALVEVKTWCVNYAQMEGEAKILYQDVYFEDRLGDVVFYGYIDQLRQHPEEGLQLVLFKTSSQLPPASYLTRDFAISLAVHAVWQGSLFPQSGDAVHLQTIPAAYCYYLPHLEQYQKNGKGKKGDLKGDPMIPVHRTQEVLLDFEYEILEAVSGIRQKYFPMRVVNPCGCSLCQFTHQCQSGVAVACVPDYAELVE
jgi:hypothetical protein